MGWGRARGWAFTPNKDETNQPESVATAAEGPKLATPWLERLEMEVVEETMPVKPLLRVLETLVAFLELAISLFVWEVAWRNVKTANLVWMTVARIEIDRSIAVAWLGW